MSALVDDDYIGTSTWTSEAHRGDHPFHQLNELSEALSMAPPQNTARLTLSISGIVQGVGFRPFIYRIATENNLTGSVTNDSGQVKIEAEGSPRNLRSFLQDFARKLPPLAQIEHIKSNVVSPLNETSFRILESASSDSETGWLSPDVATCDDCLRELRDASDPRYRYPFINCTNCGPRFSIVRDLPYDRCRTTMDAFPLCPHCGEAYRSLPDRRFHAEPIACPVCGPEMRCRDGISGKELTGEAAIRQTILDLLAGKIVAIKGVGGYHLSCNPFDEVAVKRLRHRKVRPAKPLALMFCDLETVEQYCVVSPAEREALVSFRRPIILLEKRELSGDLSTPLALSVAPSLNAIGVFLPYAPLHHLLLEEELPVLVMTSGNRSDEPIEIEADSAESKLGMIADSFLHHNREIWNRNDDSVGYLFDNQVVLTRRSRGFAPLPVKLTSSVPPILALGAMYANTFAIGVGNKAYISQHIGDIDNRETEEFLTATIEKYLRWLKVSPEVIACDLHPDLITSRLADKLANGRRVIRVQHHEAHLASLIAASGITRPVVGIAADGTGYGRDGTIWGGEILLDDRKTITRLGHLSPLPLAGGDSSVRLPYRTATGFLAAACPDLEPGSLPGWGIVPFEELKLIRQMVERKFNTTLTTSAGRLFDAVSAIAGICLVNTYEAQSAIELEAAAERAERDSKYDDYNIFDIKFEQVGGIQVIDTTSLLRQIVDAVLSGVEPGLIALGFHHALGKAFAETAIHVARDVGAETIGLSGGVFQNRLLLRMVKDRVIAAQMQPLLPGVIPVNDGGISLGQVVLAGRILQQESNQ